MPHLSLALLGPFQASLDGQPATGFESNKVRALLAYLAVESARPHSRETLAGLLWPDYPDRSALSNLRSALANLRQAIGDPQADPPFLLITRDTIRFNTAGDHELDISALRDLPGQSVDSLEQAVAAYRGDFLEGFSLADSPAFEEWALVQREEIRIKVLEALHRLAEHDESRADYERTIIHARQALALEPWDEEAHRQVMRALALGGQRSLALAQYETCSRLLRQELGAEPAQETTALAEAIRSDTLKLPAAPALRPPDAGAAPEPPAPGDPPFKGLAFFDEADAGLFFGRAALTEKLVAQVQECLVPGYAGCRFLAVLGASGGGKSSIVRAGLVPALRRLERSADDAVSRPLFGDAIYVITPTARPLEALALAFTGGAGSVAATAELLDSLARDSRSLHLAAARRTHPGGLAHLLLVVDQFEELFTLCRDEPERRAFVDNLLYAVEVPGPTVVIIALRADFYAQCAPFETLRRALSQRQEYIGVMSAAGLRQAIEEPAERGGWAFEPGLVDLLLREVGDAPGALPLLSHALLETWRRRRGRTLTLAGYQATGGVRGAIAKTAETTFKQLTPEQQGMARNIFLRLTELGESAGSEEQIPFYTRRRAPLAELTPRPADAPLARAVLTRLADARLVAVSHDTAEVAHEALIQEWSRLRRWLEENRAGLRLHRQLTEAAQEWDRMGRDGGMLYRGARLAQALEWAAGSAGDLNLQEESFLNASQAAAKAQQEAEAERQRRELLAAQALAEEQRRRAEAERQRAQTESRAAGRLRRRAIYLAVAAAGLMVLLAAALWLGRARQAQARLAISRELAAAAVNALQVDPERSVLLGLQAMETADTLEARNALHQALPELHNVLTIAAHEPGGAPGVAYSPDGARVASIGIDGTAKVWDAGSGELLQTFAGDPDTIGANIAFSPDGELLAASWASQVLVWEMADGELRWRLPGRIVGMDTTDSLAFSADSARLAVANMDGQPKVWDMANGRELFALAGHESVTDGLAYSPDGRRLATGDSAGIVKIWDAATGRELATLKHGGRVHGLAFSPDGRHLAAAGADGRLVVWDTESGGTVLSLPTSSGLYDIAYMPDGERLVSVHQDGTTMLWDAASGQPLLTLAGHLSTVISVSPSPDNIHVTTSGYDSTVRIWDTRPGRELVTMPAHAGPAYDTAYSPDGTRLATAGADGTVKLWDPASGLLALSLFPDAPGPGFSGIAFSPDGQRVAAGGVNGTVRIGDAATGRTLQILTGHTDMVWGLAFSPDGTRLATTSWDRTSRVWDLKDGEEIATHTGYKDMVFGVAFSPDGKRVFTAGDRYAREWDVATGEELRTFSGDGLDVYGLALSPDGRRMALGRQDGSVSVWDVSSGEVLRQLTGHGGLVKSVAFNQDGTRLATGSFDKLAKVWEVGTGQEIATLYGNAGNVFGVAFSPDGKQLATAGGDGTARLYTLAVEELTGLARSRVTRPLTTEECRRYLHLKQCPAGARARIPIAGTP
jgi:WD40 repeat protein/DNA-binding SARP family transcriptional activator